MIYCPHYTMGFLIPGLTNIHNIHRLDSEAQTGTLLGCPAPSSDMDRYTTCAGHVQTVQSPEASPDWFPCLGAPAKVDLDIGGVVDLAKINPGRAKPVLGH